MAPGRCDLYNRRSIGAGHIDQMIVAIEKHPGQRIQIATGRQSQHVAIDFPSIVRLRSLQRNIPRRTVQFVTVGDAGTCVNFGSYYLILV